MQVMKNVVVISTSLRGGSNSDMLAKQFVQGALAAGHEVEYISLAGKHIEFCKGCLACQKLGKCVIADDVNSLLQKVQKSDVICWATPVYYYGMSGQMKVLIDRMNALFAFQYTFREVYMLATAAEDEADTFSRVESGLMGWIDCFPQCQFAGKVCCGGVTEPLSVVGHHKLQEAYEMGQSL